MDIRTDLLYSYTGRDVISYFWSDAIAKKSVENSASEISESNFSRSAFCLAQTIGDLLATKQHHIAFDNGIRRF